MKPVQKYPRLRRLMFYVSTFFGFALIGLCQEVATHLFWVSLGYDDQFDKNAAFNVGLGAWMAVYWFSGSALSPPDRGL